MAENIVLSVQLNGADAALAQLTQLDQVLSHIKANRNVKVSVNARSLATAAGNAEKLNTNMTQVTQTTQKVGTAGAKSVEKAGKAVQTASRNAESFNNGMGNVLLTMAKFRLASGAINLVATGFKDALGEMKQVDSELATIRKVTGRTAEEMEKLGDSAYSTASKYGVTAHEYLENIGTFARAGYGDMADQLGELAIKTQLVGDVSADVAAKFLLSADAAYKYGGSAEQLSTVLDKANAVENNFATSIEKLAEGFPIVANVAATANMSIEETIAMLGTITAVTQESGTKAATAARALILNIMGDTTTEIEEGVRLTGEQVEDLQDILWKYSREAMETAQATGKIVDPMEAVAGLAKAAQEGLLTEQELARIASDIGGKLRTNQLLALINNWDMFNSQLDTMKGSIGSADAEIGVMLDTWTAKTNQLKNSWTELVATLADTSLIKGGLDFLTNGIQAITDDIKATQGLTDVENRDNAAYRSTFDLTGSLRSATTSFEKDFDAEAFTESIQGAVTAGQEFYNTLQQMKQGGEEWTLQEENFAQAFEALQNGLENGESAFDLYGYAVAAMLAAGSSAEESADGANTKLDDLASKIEALPSEKKVNIILSVTGSLPKLPGFASGTSRAPGGPALVNENGPEMISANGLAWIAGGGRPTVTMLPRGATVLTAQETRRATGGRNLSGIPAYAGGTSNREQVSDQWYEWSITDGARPGEAVFTTNNTGRKTTTHITADDLQKAATAMSDAEFWAANPELAKQYSKAREEGRKKTGEFVDSMKGAWSDSESGPTPPNFKALEEELTKRLKNLDAQAELAENEEDFVKALTVYGEAQDAIAELLEQYRANGYAEDSDEVLRLANLGYDYAHKQLNDYDELQERLIDALNALTEETDKANAIAERQEAVDKAREALRNAESQRTVRIFNPVTGQWEWVANASDVEKAREALKSAEDDLTREQIDQTIDAIKNAKPEELAGMTLTPAVLDKLFGGTPEQQSAFLNALNAATGGADYLGSAEGQTAWNQGNSIGTQYNLNGITLTEAQAAGMSIKDLLDMLRGLKVMT